VKIAAAMILIPPSGSAEQFLATARPKAVAAWQGLGEHLAQIEAISRIAAQFGCRIAPFPMITEFALGDGFKLDDRAIMCTDGPIEADSALFRGPGTHRASPWCRTVLRLHTVASSRDRYREWAAGEWDRQHGGPVASWIDDISYAHEQPRPVNPYRTTKLAKGKAYEHSARASPTHRSPTGPPTHPPTSPAAAAAQPYVTPEPAEEPEPEGD
jgi:hypothetical protein